MASMARDLAMVERAKGYQVGEFLLLRITGEKPNGCHVVDLERNLLDVEPPTFLATWYTLPNVRCVPEPVRYEYQEAFRVGVKRDPVTLHHAGGELSVDVEDLSSDTEGLVRGLATSAVPMGDVLPHGGEAVGYSRSFDFTEAFQDAIGKIPAPSIPDWLATYTVLEVGAEIGGIAGFNHMFVRVRGG